MESKIANNANAKFTQFNAEKAAQLLKEVEAEDAAYDAKQKAKQKKAKAEQKKHEERTRRRNNLLALGMTEEELIELGLGEIEVDDDPSICKQVYTSWKKSIVRKLLILGWKKLPCNQKKKEPPPPPDDDRFIKGGATRHKCGHVCMLWQPSKCCWCSDRRDVPKSLSERQQIIETENAKIEKKRLIDLEKEEKRLKKLSRRSAWRKKQDAKKEMQVEVIGSSVQFQSKYCVSIQEEEEKTMERPEVDEMDEEDRERKDVVAVDVLENAVPDDCVYPGWIEKEKKWIEQKDVYTRDQFYCHICQKLGQGGRNLGALVQEQNQKDAIHLANRLKEDEEQQMIEEEEQKRKEMIEMLRKYIQKGDGEQW